MRKSTEAVRWRGGLAASVPWGPVLAVLIVWLASVAGAWAQARPYIGFVYPAGGQQGTTFQIRLGGQALDDVTGALVSGVGVSARIGENYRRLNNQEMQLLNEQLRALRRETMSDSARASVLMAEGQTTNTDGAVSRAESGPDSASPDAKQQAACRLIDKIEKRTHEYVPAPANASIASLVLVEVIVAPDAPPGEREIRLVTLRGVSNPMAFYVGQVPEFSRPPMLTSTKQVLGKEAEALRKRPPVDDDPRVTIPCTLNGQIASGEVNHYRFEARQGQRLVVTALGRALVPFIADAVPGWFQPVLALYDANGKEVTYADDYRFNPDPSLFYEVPKDGEYRLAIHDSIYRGREDFVYRITVGELPFITSVFPLGARAGSLKEATSGATPAIQGWNLGGAELMEIPTNASPGTHWLTARKHGLVSNRVPFVLDALPEAFEREPNNAAAWAQKITLPVIINGRIGQRGDWDVFEFTGRSNDTVIMEVQARRLASPLDSIIKLTDQTGQLLALNDDHPDAGAGVNTHQADSYLSVRLSVDGTYYIHIGDTAGQGGPEYAYRLRVSAPQPDFELRVVPSSVSLRSKSAAPLTVYALRKDGFDGPIQLSSKDPPSGFSVTPATIGAGQTVGRLTLKTTLAATEEPLNLTVTGTANIGDGEVTREAVPAEDRMQAFLWRSLVPAQELKVLVFDPSYQPPPKHVAPVRPRAIAGTNTPPPAAPAPAVIAATTTNLLAGTNGLAGTNAAALAAKPKFSKQLVAARLRQLKLLFEEGMLTEDFYVEKVFECEAGE